jgi:hypothetical protein
VFYVQQLQQKWESHQQVCFVSLPNTMGKWKLSGCHTCNAIHHTFAVLTRDWWWLNPLLHSHGLELKWQNSDPHFTM